MSEPSVLALLIGGPLSGEIMEVSSIRPTLEWHGTAEITPVVGEGEKEVHDVKVTYWFLSLSHDRTEVFYVHESLQDSFDAVLHLYRKAYD